MAFLDTHRFDRLTEDEILRRIGELLAIASGRFEESQRPRALEVQTPTKAGATSERRAFDPTQFSRDSLEQQIISHLRKAGTATPQELGAVLGLSRRTISRKLARLRSSGLCVVEGSTRMACYRVRTEFGDN